jgi:Tfp pilus assembly protein PilF
LIGVAVLAAYADCYRGVLVLDDPGTLAENTTIRHLSTGLFPPAAGLPVSGRPLANLSFALNYLIGGTNLGGYHALSLLIHLGAALLLFGLVRRFSSTGFGVAVALLWGVHPLLTSAVTYLSQRPESLMGFWYLLTVYAFVRAMDGGPRAGPLLARPWALVSVASCCCGMATKEVMVTAPLLVLGFDWTWYAASLREIWERRRGFYAALAASWAIVAALALHTGSRAGTAGFGAGLPWWAYAIAQVGAILHYLRLALWPAPLIADYGRLIGGSPLSTGLGLAVLLALLAATAGLLRRHSPWGLCGAWFFLILAPSSSVIPITTEIVAEHRMYLPLAGVVVLVVGGAAGVGRAMLKSIGGRGRTVVGAAVVLAATTALAAATYRRNQVYGSLDAFWGDVAAKVPANAGAHNNLGNLALGRRNWKAAEAEYSAALALEPQYADAHGNLGVVLAHTQRSAAAIGHFEAALRYQPDNAIWRRGLADARADTGNGLAESGQSAQAIAEYQAALALAPEMADIRNNLGGLLAQSGRLREAEAQFAEAVRLQPNYREAQNNLRRVRQMEGLGVGP